MNTKPIPAIQEAIERFRQLGLEPLCRLDLLVFADKTAIQVIEDFIASELLNERERTKKKYWII